MSSSERGIKFREKQQQRQIKLLADAQLLRQQILRLQASRDMRAEQTFTTPYTSTGAPLKFVMEYFDQFQYGLRVPGMPASVLSSERQSAFLQAMIEPGAKFGDAPAVELILGVWQRYSTFHSSVRLSCVSADLITTDNCSTVLVHGILHLRYSRRTIQNVFPHAIGEEELVQKLIGRQLHVHYKAYMHFNACGKLERYEVVPDFVSALMEVMGDIGECERMLGRALIKEHRLGDEPEPEAEAEVNVEGPAVMEIHDEDQAVHPAYASLRDDDVRGAETANTASSAMDLDYILS